MFAEDGALERAANRSNPAFATKPATTKDLEWAALPSKNSPRWCPDSRSAYSLLPGLPSTEPFYRANFPVRNNFRIAGIASL